MPNDPGTALTPRREFEVQLDAQVQNFRALLPSHIPVEKFKRVVVVAVAQNPDLFHADRRSFFTAAQKCASDGLLPDGRQAALVVYNTKTKVRLQDGTHEERWVPAVQYMPMIAGVRQRMRNSGEVLSAEAHIVYHNDKFFQKFGDDPAIVHEPPSFGVDRGEPVGAYAIIKLKNGEILREVMDHRQIERVRSFSKSKDGPAWKNWWEEMARKTVLRRCAKAAPNSADVDALLDRDEESPTLSPLVELSAHASEPEPHRQIADDGDELAEDGESYVVIDADGEEHEFATLDGAARALRAVFDDARRRGRAAMEAATENNAATIAEMRENAPDLWREQIDPFGLPPLDGSATNTPAGTPQPQPQERATGGQDGSVPNHSDQPPAEATIEANTDLLSGQPAENLTVPLGRNPSTADFEYFARQAHAMLNEKPRTAQRLAQIRMKNEAGLAKLKAALPDVYDQLQRELAR